MGHAGAWAAPGESSAAQKHKILQDAGVTMVNHPAKFGNAMKGLLSRTGGAVASGSQSRGFHTIRRLPRASQRAILPLSPQQRRRLVLRADQATTLLTDAGFTVWPSPPTSLSESCLLSMTVDRSARSPCIIASPTADPHSIHQRSRRFPFDYRTGPTQADITAILAHAGLSASPPAASAKGAALITALFDLFKSKEAVALTVHVSTTPSGDGIAISSPDLSFDDAASRSTRRHAALHALRDTSLEDAVELSAERDGIVYVKLSSRDDAAANIGTLVNGAGLAMNTVDALAALGGRAANFLDTGGKATAETVKRSFELILQDARVRVVFVNIFGGLTLGDMIARGVILAFEELSVPVPVVVRIRGTNEKEGQRLIAESGLQLFAFDDFEEAARKVMELAEKGMKGG